MISLSNMFIITILTLAWSCLASSWDPSEIRESLSSPRKTLLAQNDESACFDSSSSDGTDQCSSGFFTDIDTDPSSDSEEDVTHLEVEHPLPDTYPSQYTKNAQGHPILCSIAKDTGHVDIAALNDEQARLFFATQDPSISYIICSGPAGCGKTYLTAAFALHTLLTNRISRIVLTRPMCTSGEGIGILPGDVNQKFEPFARPMLDAMAAIIGKRHTDSLILQKKIEIIPIGLIRGANYKDCFVLMDEAQNSLIEQVKLVVSRLQIAHGGKIIISGDLKQSDLPPRSANGLAAALSVLQDRVGAQTSVVYFSHRHIIRNTTIASTLKAFSTQINPEVYEKWVSNRACKHGEKLQEERERTQTTLTFAATRITPSNVSQENIYRALQSHSIVFAVGTSGCGKTFYAIACALHMLLNDQTSKVLLTKPCVDNAGESLGFLPGNMQSKLEQRMQNMLDILPEILDSATREALLKEEKIQLVSIDFMRGREFTNSVVVVDEAQNVTHRQMQMILTRLGKNAHIIFTGDPSQTDLTPKASSGLEETLFRLRHLSFVKQIFFQSEENVRNPEMEHILNGFDDFQREHWKNQKIFKRYIQQKNV